MRKKLSDAEFFDQHNAKFSRALDSAEAAGEGYDHIRDAMIRESGTIPTEVKKNEKVQNHES